MSGDHDNGSKKYFDIQGDVKANQNITSVWGFELNSCLKYFRICMIEVNIMQQTVKCQSIENLMCYVVKFTNDK